MATWTPAKMGTPDVNDALQAVTLRALQQCDLIYLASEAQPVLQPFFVLQVAQHIYGGLARQHLDLAFLAATADALQVELQLPGRA